MTSATGIAKRYFQALDEHDLEGADSIPVRGDVASQLREVAASAA